MVRSSEAETSCLPSGEKATDRTESVWPSSVRIQQPEAGSQILTVRSSEAEASGRTSGEKATDLTQEL